MQAERSIYPGKTGISGTYALGKLGYSHFLVRPTYTTPAPCLAGFGPEGDRFAQAVHQPFQVRHAFAEFTKLGAQRINFSIQPRLQPRHVLPHPAKEVRITPASATLTPASATPTVTMAMISGSCFLQISRLSLQHFIADFCTPLPVAQCMRSAARSHPRTSPGNF